MPQLFLRRIVTLRFLITCIPKDMGRLIPAQIFKEQQLTGFETSADFEVISSCVLTRLYCSPHQVALTTMTLLYSNDQLWSTWAESVFGNEFGDS